MTSSREPQLQTSDDLPICEACGTQYLDPKTESCRICLDPRQFVPPTGQAWTTLAKIRAASHKNVWHQDPVNPNIWSIRTEPTLSIGQRAMLLQTPHGNILWDMITLLDTETVQRIHSLGGLAAIAISHPHYYTTIHDWAATFPDTPIYVGAPDEEWLQDVPGAAHSSGRKGPSTVKFLTAQHTPILPSVTAILSGGHFPGSLCLHWDAQLFIADTILTVPSALNPEPGKEENAISYTFWYSVPNRIPLSPAEIWGVWESVRGLKWHSTFGAFLGMDVRTSEEEVKRGTGGVKGRLLESVRVFVRMGGWVGNEQSREGNWEAVRKMVQERTEGSEVAPGAEKVKAKGMEMEFEL